MVGRLLLFYWGGLESGKVISGSGSIKRRSEEIEKMVGDENKILVLGYFGSASKFWVRFYGFGAGWGKRAAPRKKKNMPRHLKNIAPQYNNPSRIF